MDRYKDLTYMSRNGDLNNFSHWFPKIEHCGIKVPKSVIIQIPDEMWRGETFYMENIPEDEARIERFVRDTVMPKVKDAKLRTLLFIKNGAFSNKFDAAMNCFCKPDVYDLTRSIANIQYFSICNETGGESEIVIRERIGSRDDIIPRIYNGLPLRPEFRVFYDFDLHEPIFTVDYWDFDYVYPHLYDATDRIIFERMGPYLRETFELEKDHVTELVADAMKTVTELNGPWSIDIMMSNYPADVQQKLINDFRPQYYNSIIQPEIYLIDMAVAERSAYWDQRPQKEE